MKNAALIVIVLLVVFGAGFGVGVKYATLSTPRHVLKPSQPVAGQPPRVPPPTNMPTAAEFQEFRAAREKTLHENPELAAEYKALLAEINQHQADIEAAMIKADPTVAPIVAKLAWQRQQNMAQTAAAARQVQGARTP